MTSQTDSPWLPDPLRAKIDSTLVSALGRILSAPSSGAGLIPVLNVVAMSIELFGKELQRVDITQQADRVSGLVRVLAADAETPSQVRALPAPNLAATQFSVLLAAAQAIAEDEGDPITFQLLGAVLLFHFATAKVLPGYQVEKIGTLLNWRRLPSNYRSAWAEFAKALSLDPIQLHAAASGSELASIRDLGEWLSVAVTYVCSHPFPSSTASTDSAAKSATAETDSDGQGRGDGNSASAQNWRAKKQGRSDDPPSPGSLVLWQFSRASKTSSAGSAGLDDWDWLSPAELRRALKVVIQAIRSADHLEARLAVAAVMSLATGLPIRMLLGVSLRPNRDLWIDIATSEFVWHLGQLVVRDPVSDALLANGFRPESTVRLPLPLSVNVVFGTIPGEAATVHQGLFPLMSADAVESRFGTFLRAASGDDPRKPFSARFAYSLGSSIVEVTGDTVAAAYCALDFRHLAASEPNYLCLPAGRLFDAAKATYDWLGLGPIAGIRPTGYVGSPLAPRPEVYWAAVASLAKTLAQSSDKVGSRAAFNVAAERFNARAETVSGLFVLLAGERGTAIERRTVGAISGHSEIAIIYDKSTSRSAERPVPITPFVRALLSNYLEDARSLAGQARRAGLVRIAVRLESIANLERPNAIVFVKVVIGRKGKPQLAPIRTGDIARVLEPYGIASNGGRHYWLTFLSEARYPVYLRRILSGHGSKAGQAFHYAGGIPPVDGLAELREVLAAEEARHEIQVFGKSMGQQPKHLPMVRLRPLPSSRITDSAVAAFARFDARNAGRRSRLYKLSTAAGYSHAEAIRKVMLADKLPLAAGSALVLSLVLIDGVSEPRLCKMAWIALTTRRTTRLLDGLACEVELECGRRQLLLPLPPSVLLLHEYLASGSGEDFEQACVALMTWLERAAPRIVWPDGPEQVLAVLCGLGKQLKLFEMAPWLASAENIELGAASISLSALVRIVTKRPRFLDGGGGVGRRVRRSRGEVGTLGHIVRRLNDVANPNKRYGEERARKVLVLDRLSEMEVECPVEFPMTRGVGEYVRAESEPFPVHGKPIDVATLAGYVSSLASALSKFELTHPEDLPKEGWLEIEAELLREAERSKTEFDHSALRRFARYWLSQGADVPPELFAEGSGRDFKRAAHSAASHLVWDFEWRIVRGIILAQLPDGSLAHEVHQCYLQVISEAPQRAAETNFLRLADLDESLHQVVVTSSGFSHLKGNDESRRVMTLTPEMTARLARLRTRLRGFSPSRVYFFFSGTDPSKDREFVAMVASVSAALRYATGEPGARRHTLRGVAACRLLVADIDRFVLDAMGLGVPTDGESMLLIRGNDAWRSIVRTSSQAGHHPLTCVSTYLTIWVLAARRRRLDILDGMWPGERYCKLGGVSAGQQRVIKHRAEKSGSGSLALWKRLLKTIDLDAMATITLPPGSIIEAINGDGGDDDDDSESVELETNERAARVVLCAGLLLCGADVTLAKDLSLSSDLVLPRKVAESLERQLGFPKSSKKDSMRLMRHCGLQLATHLNRLPDVDLLRQAVAAISEVQRMAPASASDLMTSMQVLCKVLPDGWSVALLPEVEGLPRNAAPRLRSIRADLRIKPPSRFETSKFRFTVTAPGSSLTSPRSQGASTRVLCLLLRVAIELLSARVIEQDVDG